jgi:hypothetical protein
VCYRTPNVTRVQYYRYKIGRPRFRLYLRHIAGSHVSHLSRTHFHVRFASVSCIGEPRHLSVAEIISGARIRRL